ncbi:NAD-dependent epimerase/dehydratase family protein [Tuwongella immobilis]|uniref:NAD-dependent epimerase/dehydratase domain-containing protein n=1 Tax=Tuwongella immobilis TaxID=692036 RepID=A0A6C2YLG6_9BACT|nr:NAD-dependent epimerase/dehydratase family protein [Tuwongella immobilis]VIP02079.1 nad-dependent epimerase : L-threonine 3-dehydrogenase OS=Cystobacter fuscus DSM 2262 GN=D187_004264 PE=4 SV=1: Epimerase [Tuwongella immobilis]VTS00324.1 nad-dependent epimerase : L-threonine 3-dehydrogenase OS=Cystobacter fuscus DSM 2262 GN=D187_004264 PE=4 SV=1: Epimerase [Tuwongella immobilis]
MRQRVVLITGAGGEIGHSLINRLGNDPDRPVITLDLNPLAPSLAGRVRFHYTGSILDAQLLDRILAEYQVERIFHLAALLSTRSEFAPVTAHRVNVEGTMTMLDFAQKQAESHGHPVVFMYPSSIAAFGMPNLSIKQQAGAVLEDDFNHPTTMYGCNKLYCEHLGRYYARHYKQLASENLAGKVDFRCIRFPGLISAFTVPSGGTSDYGPEMIHAAAKGTPYACFVRLDTRIPFMTMPDAVEALLKFADAPREKLTRTVYNLKAFSPTAEEFAQMTKRFFPDAVISTQLDAKRQGIVDSWPADVNDEAARRDWGFDPQHSFEQAFTDYLVPQLRKSGQSAGH